MDSLRHKYLSASKATFNFMTIIRVRKVYYKCFCHEELFTAASITELDDLNMEEFFARREVDQESYCSRCKVYRRGHFEYNSIVYLPEILIFYSDSILDSQLDLSKYMDPSMQI